MTQGVAGEECLCGGGAGKECTQSPSGPTKPSTHRASTPDEDHEERQAADDKQDVRGDAVHRPSSLGVTKTVD